MPLVAGVSFRKAGKVYYFDPAGIELSEGDLIVAETARGIEFGEIATVPKIVPDEEVVPPLKKIIRKATQSDIEKAESFRGREKQAFHICQQKIHTHNLQMKLIDAEYCFDGSQITFYFSADSRIDFRELVKDLAGNLRTKVQLHQVGVRDEAKIFGGMGPCGRSLCCASFLNGFEPVSMKMAKEQSLFLNPLKFSGICGKLMCCLKYEYPMYKESKAKLPSLGSTLTTPSGSGRVTETNVIKESFKVEFEDGTVSQFTTDDMAEWATGCTDGARCQKSESCCKGCAPKPEPSAPIAAKPVVEHPKPSQPAGNSKPAEQAQSDSEDKPKSSSSRRRRRGGRRSHSPKKAEEQA